jgi:hypothetical protein
MELTKSQKQGKIAELLVFEKLIEHGWEIFTPLVDTGIDAILRKRSGDKLELIELQIKSVISKEQSGCFRVDDVSDVVSGEKFFIICVDLSEEEHKCWILPSKTFEELSRVSRNKEKNYSTYILDIYSKSKDEEISKRLADCLYGWDKLEGK